MVYKKETVITLAEFIRTKITPCGGLRCTSTEAADMILHFLDESIPETCKTVVTCDEGIYEKRNENDNR